MKILSLLQMIRQNKTAFKIYRSRKPYCVSFCTCGSCCALFYHSGITFYHVLLTRIIRLLGYLLLTLGLSPVLLLSFVQVVQASENTVALSSPYIHHLWGNDKRLPATLTPWKEVDLVYARMFSYDPARQPHPPAGCVVLPVISTSSDRQDNGITAHSAVLMLQCRERINLLRPVRWVRSRLREQNLQGYLWLSIPEMGIIDVQVHMVAIKPSSFNPIALKLISILARPVIGLFIRHTTNVKQYTFKDTITGKIERIKATPNHPFYVLNQHRYIPVSNLSSHDKMINVLGHLVALVCPRGKSSHCGQPYHPGQVITVYNLEVYGQHRYFVGQPGIMVHNGYYDYKCPVCRKEFKNEDYYTSHVNAGHADIETAIKKPYVCKLCNRRFARSYHLNTHFKLHTGERPHVCMLCDKTFITRGAFRQHFLKSHGNNEITDALGVSADAHPEASGSSAGTEPMRERSRSPTRSDIPSKDFIPPGVVQPPPPIDTRSTL